MQRDIPVIVLKVGRSPESAALAVSHSGALVGDEAVQNAVFRRHGVIVTDTLDEFANSLLLLSQPRRMAKGRLASIHDSGGERELFADRVSARGMSFARISEATKAKLAARLDYGLDPVNPLDAWGTGHDYQKASSATACRRCWTIPIRPSARSAWRRAAAIRSTRAMRGP